MTALRVGTGKKSLTPPEDMFPIPVSAKKDWGTSAFVRNAPYDEMHVRAIAIDNGEETFIWVAYESGGHPSVPDLEAKMSEAAGVPAENIFVAGTHNHTGAGAGGGVDPATYSEELKKWVIRNDELILNAGIEACVEAVRSLRPAKYGYGEIDSYVNVNRDLHTLGGYWVEGRNPGGYSDRTLAIIKFVDMEDKLIAAFLNYGCHATCCYMSKDFDHFGKTSGNFTGIACRFVEQHYGNNAVCMWTSGAAGNQNPLLSHGLQYEYPDGYTTAVPLPDGVPFMMMECMGRTHGADAVRGIDGISHYLTAMPVKRAKNTVGLVAQKRADGKPKQQGAVRQGGVGLRPESIPYGTVPAPEFPEMVVDTEKTNPMNMEALILGDIAMIFTNGEMYAELGKQMKETSPYRKTILVTHAGPGRTSYILDKGSADHKVFQAFSPNMPGASDDIIINGVQELFDKVVEEN